MRRRGGEGRRGEMIRKGREERRGEMIRRRGEGRLPWKGKARHHDTDTLKKTRGVEGRDSRRDEERRQEREYRRRRKSESTEGNQRWTVPLI